MACQSPSPTPPRKGTKGTKRCTCCPHGYHIDVDFVDFAQEANSGHHCLSKVPRYRGLLSKPGSGLGVFYGDSSASSTISTSTGDHGDVFFPGSAPIAERSLQLPPLSPRTGSPFENISSHARTSFTLPPHMSLNSPAHSYEPPQHSSSSRHPLYVDFSQHFPFLEKLYHRLRDDLRLVAADERYQQLDELFLDIDAESADVRRMSQHFLSRHSEFLQSLSHNLHESCDFAERLQFLLFLLNSLRIYCATFSTASALLNLLLQQFVANVQFLSIALTSSQVLPPRGTPADIRVQLTTTITSTVPMTEVQDTACDPIAPQGTPMVFLHSEGSSSGEWLVQRRTTVQHASNKRPMVDVGVTCEDLRVPLEPRPSMVDGGTQVEGASQETTHSSIGTQWEVNEAPSTKEQGVSVEVQTVVNATVSHEVPVVTRDACTDPLIVRDTEGSHVSTVEEKHFQDSWVCAETEPSRNVSHALIQCFLEDVQMSHSHSSFKHVESSKVTESSIEGNSHQDIHILSHVVAELDIEPVHTSHVATNTDPPSESVRHQSAFEKVDTVDSSQSTFIAPASATQEISVAVTCNSLSIQFSHDAVERSTSTEPFVTSDVSLCIEIDVSNQENDVKVVQRRELSSSPTNDDKPSQPLVTATASCLEFDIEDMSCQNDLQTTSTLFLDKDVMVISSVDTVSNSTHFELQSRNMTCESNMAPVSLTDSSLQVSTIEVTGPQVQILKFTNTLTFNDEDYQPKSDTKESSIIHISLEVNTEEEKHWRDQGTFMDERLSYSKVMTKDSSTSPDQVEHIDSSTGTGSMSVVSLGTFSGSVELISACCGTDCGSSTVSTSVASEMNSEDMACEMKMEVTVSHMSIAVVSDEEQRTSAEVVSDDSHSRTVESRGTSTEQVQVTSRTSFELQSKDEVCEQYSSTERNLIQDALSFAETTNHLDTSTEADEVVVECHAQLEATKSTTVNSSSFMELQSNDAVSDVNVEVTVAHVSLGLSGEDVKELQTKGVGIDRTQWHLIHNVLSFTDDVEHFNASTETDESSRTSTEQGQMTSPTSTLSSSSFSEFHSKDESSEVNTHAQIAHMSLEVTSSEDKKQTLEKGNSTQLAEKILIQDMLSFSEAVENVKVTSRASRTQTEDSISKDASSEMNTRMQVAHMSLAVSSSEEKVLTQEQGTSTEILEQMHLVLTTSTVSSSSSMECQSMDVASEVNAHVQVANVGLSVNSSEEMIHTKNLILDALSFAEDVDHVDKSTVTDEEVDDEVHRKSAEKVQLTSTTYNSLTQISIVTGSTSTKLQSKDEGSEMNTLTTVADASLEGTSSEDKEQGSSIEIPEKKLIQDALAFEDEVEHSHSSTETDVVAVECHGTSTEQVEMVSEMSSTLSEISIVMSSASNELQSKDEGSEMNTRMILAHASLEGTSSEDNEDSSTEVVKRNLIQHTLSFSDAVKHSHSSTETDEVAVECHGTSTEQMQLASTTSSSQTKISIVTASTCSDFQSKEEASEMKTKVRLAHMSLAVSSSEDNVLTREQGSSTEIPERKLIQDALSFEDEVDHLHSSTETDVVAVECHGTSTEQIQTKSEVSSTLTEISIVIGSASNELQSKDESSEMNTRTILAHASLEGTSSEDKNKLTHDQDSSTEVVVEKVPIRHALSFSEAVEHYLHSSTETDVVAVECHVTSTEQTTSEVSSSAEKTERKSTQDVLSMSEAVDNFNASTETDVVDTREQDSSSSPDQVEHFDRSTGTVSMSVVSLGTFSGSVELISACCGTDCGSSTVSTSVASEMNSEDMACEMKMEAKVTHMSIAVVSDEEQRTSTEVVESKLIQDDSHSRAVESRGTSTEHIHLEDTIPTVNISSFMELTSKDADSEVNTHVTIANLSIAVTSSEEMILIQEKESSEGISERKLIQNALSYKDDTETDAVSVESHGTSTEQVQVTSRTSFELQSKDEVCEMVCEQDSSTEAAERNLIQDAMSFAETAEYLHLGTETDEVVVVVACHGTSTEQVHQESSTLTVNMASFSEFHCNDAASEMNMQSTGADVSLLVVHEHSNQLHEKKLLTHEQGTSAEIKLILDSLSFTKECECSHSSTETDAVAVKCHGTSTEQLDVVSTSSSAMSEITITKEDHEVKEFKDDTTAMEHELLVIEEVNEEVLVFKEMEANLTTAEKGCQVTFSEAKESTSTVVNIQEYHSFVEKTAASTVEKLVQESFSFVSDIEDEDVSESAKWHISHISIEGSSSQMRNTLEEGTSMVGPGTRTPDMTHASSEPIHFNVVEETESASQVEYSTVSTSTDAVMENEATETRISCTLIGHVIGEFDSQPLEVERHSVGVSCDILTNSSQSHHSEPTSIDELDMVVKVSKQREFLADVSSVSTVSVKLTKDKCVDFSQSDLCTISHLAWKDVEVKEMGTDQVESHTVEHSSSNTEPVRVADVSAWNADVSQHDVTNDLVPIPEDIVAIQVEGDGSTDIIDHAEVTFHETSSTMNVSFVSVSVGGSLPDEVSAIDILESGSSYENTFESHKQFVEQSTNTDHLLMSHMGVSLAFQETEPEPALEITRPKNLHEKSTNTDYPLVSHMGVSMTVYESQSTPRNDQEVVQTKNVVETSTNTEHLLMSHMGVSLAFQETESTPEPDLEITRPKDVHEKSTNTEYPSVSHMGVSLSFQETQTTSEVGQEVIKHTNLHEKSTNTEHALVSHMGVSITVHESQSIPKDDQEIVQTKKVVETSTNTEHLLMSHMGVSLTFQETQSKPEVELDDFKRTNIHEKSTNTEHALVSHMGVSMTASLTPEDDDLDVITAKQFEKSTNTEYSLISHMGVSLAFQETEPEPALEITRPKDLHEKSTNTEYPLLSHMGVSMTVYESQSTPDDDMEVTKFTNFDSKSTSTEFPVVSHMGSSLEFHETQTTSEVGQEVIKHTNLHEKSTNTEHALVSHMGVSITVHESQSIPKDDQEVIQTKNVVESSTNTEHLLMSHMGVSLTFQETQFAPEVELDVFRHTNLHEKSTNTEHALVSHMGVSMTVCESQPTPEDDLEVIKFVNLHSKSTNTEYPLVSHMVASLAFHETQSTTEVAQEIVKNTNLQEKSTNTEHERQSTLEDGLAVTHVQKIEKSTNTEYPSVSHMGVSLSFQETQTTSEVGQEVIKHTNLQEKSTNTEHALVSHMGVSMTVHESQSTPKDDQEVVQTKNVVETSTNTEHLLMSHMGVSLTVNESQSTAEVEIDAFKHTNLHEKSTNTEHALVSHMGVSMTVHESQSIPKDDQEVVQRKEVVETSTNTEHLLMSHMGVSLTLQEPQFTPEEVEQDVSKHTTLQEKSTNTEHALVSHMGVSLTVHESQPTPEDDTEVIKCVNLDSKSTNTEYPSVSHMGVSMTLCDLHSKSTNTEHLLMSHMGVSLTFQETPTSEEIGQEIIKHTNLQEKSTNTDHALVSHMGVCLTVHESQPTTGDNLEVIQSKKFREIVLVPDSVVPQPAVLNVVHVASQSENMDAPQVCHTSLEIMMNQEELVTDNGTNHHPSADGRAVVVVDNFSEERYSCDDRCTNTDPVHLLTFAEEDRRRLFIELMKEDLSILVSDVECMEHFRTTFYSLRCHEEVKEEAVQFDATMTTNEEIQEHHLYSLAMGKGVSEKFPCPGEDKELECVVEPFSTTSIQWRAVTVDNLTCEASTPVEIVQINKAAEEVISATGGTGGAVNQVVKSETTSTVQQVCEEEEVEIREVVIMNPRTRRKMTSMSSLEVDVFHDDSDLNYLDVSVQVSPARSCRDVAVNTSQTMVPTPRESRCGSRCGTLTNLTDSVECFPTSPMENTSFSDLVQQLEVLAQMDSTDGPSEGGTAKEMSDSVTTQSCEVTDSSRLLTTTSVTTKSVTYATVNLEDECEPETKQNTSCKWKPGCLDPNSRRLATSQETSTFVGLMPKRARSVNLNSDSDLDSGSPAFFPHQAATTSSAAKKLSKKKSALPQPTLRKPPRKSLLSTTSLSGSGCVHDSSEATLSPPNVPHSSTVSSSSPVLSPRPTAPYPPPDKDKITTTPTTVNPSPEPSSSTAHIDSSTREAFRGELEARIRKNCETVTRWCHDSTHISSNELNAALHELKEEWFHTILNPMTLPFMVDFVQLLMSYHPLLAQRVVNMSDEKSNTALHYACGRGAWSVVSSLIQVPKVEATKLNRTGYSPLMLAAYTQIDEAALVVVRNLLQLSNVDQHADNERAETALLLAAQKNNLAMIRALLAAGADVNARDSDGNTALIWAAEYGLEELTKLLLLHPHTDCGLLDANGKSAVDIAMENRHEQIALLIYTKQSSKKKSKKAKRRHYSASSSPSPMDRLPAPKK